MYLELLRGLLTEEQIEALGGLKKREARDDRGRGGREGGWNRGGNNRGFGSGREEFMKQFDKDGDGKLSESEREAIRDHFRNGGTHGSGSPVGGDRSPR